MTPYALVYITYGSLPDNIAYLSAELKHHYGQSFELNGYVFHLILDDVI